MPRKTDYLYKKKDCQNWFLRIQLPGIAGTYKSIRKSLGTPDRTQAEIRAADEINEHRKRIWHNKLCRTAPRQLLPKLPPNTLHTFPDGHRAAVTDTHVIHLNDDGTTRTSPNGGLVFDASPQQLRELEALDPKPDDESFIRTWIEHNGLNKHIANEAFAAWALFRQQVTKKPLKDLTWEDGEALAKLLFEKGNKSATVEKKIGHLRAAMNLQIKRRKLTFNPFSDVVAKRDDKQDREPLTEDEMRLVRENAHRLRPEDWLLWRLLACTGMRLDEAFQINREYEECEVRYVLIGTKSEASRRRVPLPECLLAELPARIDRPLFTEGSETVGKRLRYFLRSLGISHHRTKKTGNPAKVVHSLRHRAADRLRSLDCPESVQLELLGHEIKTVAAGYGNGSPMPKLKKFVDQIGF
jgi:integrase